MVGNLANNFFREAKALRQDKSLDVHLFVTKDSSVHPAGLPESDDSALADGYPKWISTMPFSTGRDFLFLARLRTRPQSPHLVGLVEFLNSFDVVFLSGQEIMLAPALTSTVILRPTGGDLNLYPFIGRSISFELLRSSRRLMLTPRGILKIFSVVGKALLFKNAVLSSDFVALHQRGPYPQTAAKLRIRPEKIIPGLELSIDVQKFKPSPVSSLSKSTVSVEQTRRKDFVVFLVGRYMSKSNRMTRKIGQWKSSERALHGFKIFFDSLSEEEAMKAKLWIPRTGLSPEAGDALELATAIGIRANVVTVEGSDSRGLNREELSAVFSRANVALDDFGAGWFGSAVLESLAFGCPMITWVPPSYMSKAFPDHPLLLAREPLEIANNLRAVWARTSEEQQSARRINRLWVHSNFSGNATVQNYKNVLKHAGFLLT